MSKKGSKDWFGDAVRKFEKINKRQGKKETKVETLAEQIKRIEKEVEEEKEKKRIEKEKENGEKIRWHKDSINFTREGNFN